MDLPLLPASEIMQANTSPSSERGRLERGRWSVAVFFREGDEVLVSQSPDLLGSVCASIEIPKG